LEIPTLNIPLRKTNKFCNVLLIARDQDFFFHLQSGFYFRPTLAQVSNRD